MARQEGHSTFSAKLKPDRAWRVLAAQELRCASPAGLITHAAQSTKSGTSPPTPASHVLPRSLAPLPIRYLRRLYHSADALMQLMMDTQTVSLPAGGPDANAQPS